MTHSEPLITKFNPGSNYSVVPNGIFKLSLSPQALAIVMYINHLPTNWVLSTLELCEAFNLTPNTVNKYIRELRQAGVLQITYKRSARGRITGIRQWILCMPQEAPTDEGPHLKQEKDIRLQSPITGGFDPRYAVSKGMPTLTQKLHTIKETVHKKHEETKSAHARMHVCEAVKGFDYQKGMNAPQKKRAFYEAFKNKVSSIFKAPPPKTQVPPFSPEEQQAYERFVAHRNHAHPVSYEQKRALQRRLLELKKEGHDICSCIETSMRRGFNDVFPPKSKATQQGFLDRLLEQYKGLGLNAQNVQDVIWDALSTFDKLIHTYRGLSLGNIAWATLKAYKSCEKEN
ncbi:Rrf2 family transcriptional regulator [Helicobacter mehlei]|uniref:Rrf2 family transcriptional regulator n=1 Tax=Helicobacter mehlei TaxID=2316080 RepID=A0A553UMR7_9HELI|nr:winged helix-turn-helix domain-containing protein [Helicobacter mehlei]TSA81483.1 Rrf2 family transcriptional regulator [Helicobacter mehlei]